MSEAQVDAVELSIEEGKKTVHLRDALNLLSQNAEFKEIILEGYFKNEASRLVLLRADPAMQSEEIQKSIDNSIIAVGNLRVYLNTIMQLGSMAEKALIDDQDAREHMLGEDD